MRFHEKSTPVICILDVFSGWVRRNSAHLYSTGPDDDGNTATPLDSYGYGDRHARANSNSYARTIPGLQHRLPACA